MDPTSTVWWLLWILNTRIQDPEVNWTTYYRASSDASREGVTQGPFPPRLLLAVCELSVFSFHLVIIWESVSSFP